MSKTLKIPEYWYTDERLQPLVEAKTVNGNKVMIPQILQDSWRRMELYGQDLLENPDSREKLQRGCPEDASFRKRLGYDSRRLYFEIGQD